MTRSGLGQCATCQPGQNASLSDSVWSARIVGFDLVGPSGPVGSFAVSTASGTPYGPGGVLPPAVPVLPYER